MGNQTGLAPREVDAIDKKIMLALESNVRRSHQEIANEIGTSSPTVKRRIDRLREKGLLHLAPILDIHAAGYEYLLIIEVKAEGCSPTVIANAIAELEETLTVNVVVGVCDVVMVAVVKHREALNSLLIDKLATIEGVAQVNSAMALEVWKFQRGKITGAREELPAKRSQLDELDMRIAEQLNRDVRASNSAIANTLSVSESAVRSRIKNMLRNKQLSLAMPYPVPPGLVNDAIVGLQVKGGMASSVCQALSDMDEVSFVCTALGQYTVICCIHLTELEELTQILYQKVNGIPGVKNIHLLHCIKRVKHQSFLGIVP